MRKYYVGDDWQLATVLMGSLANVTVGVLSVDGDGWAWCELPEGQFDYSQEYPDNLVCIQLSNLRPWQSVRSVGYKNGVRTVEHLNGMVEQTRLNFATK
jgi:hypothetical protein